MFKIVKNAIDEWNPYSLLPDAPSDEFDDESSIIAARIDENSSIDEIASVVSDVFSKMFDEPKYFCKENCMGVARAIKSKLKGTSI